MVCVGAVVTIGREISNRMRLASPPPTEGGVSAEWGPTSSRLGRLCLSRQASAPIRCCERAIATVDMQQVPMVNTNRRVRRDSQLIVAMKVHLLGRIPTSRLVEEISEWLLLAHADEVE